MKNNELKKSNESQEEVVAKVTTISGLGAGAGAGIAFVMGAPLLLPALIGAGVGICGAMFLTEELRN